MSVQLQFHEATSGTHKQQQQNVGEKPVLHRKRRHVSSSSSASQPSSSSSDSSSAAEDEPTIVDQKTTGEPYNKGKKSKGNTQPPTVSDSSSEPESKSSQPHKQKSKKNLKQKKLSKTTASKKHQQYQPIYEDYLTEPVEAASLESAVEKLLSSYLQKAAASNVDSKKSASLADLKAPPQSSTSSSPVGPKPQARGKKVVKDTRLLQQISKSFDLLQAKLKKALEDSGGAS